MTLTPHFKESIGNKNSEIMLTNHFILLFLHYKTHYMTKAEIKAEIQRIKRTIRFLINNQANIIRLGGEETYEAQLNYALDKIRELKEKLESLDKNE